MHYSLGLHKFIFGPNTKIIYPNFNISLLSSVGRALDCSFLVTNTHNQFDVIERSQECLYSDPWFDSGSEEEISNIFAQIKGRRRNKANHVFFALFDKMFCKLG